MDFVVGHPRSGTMFLSRLLNACRPGVSAHELLFALSWDSVWVPSEFYAGRADARLVSRLLDAYQHRQPGLQIDSNWKLTWILPVLVEKFPEARVLHLVRDPREAVKSCHDLDYYGPLDELDPTAAEEPVRRRDYWRHWMPRVQRDDWDSLSRLARNCEFWAESQRLCLAAADPLGDRYRRVRVEALDDDLEVARVAAHFGLPAPSDEALAGLRAAGRINAKAHEKREVQARGGTTLPEPSSWDAATRETFARHCGSLAQSLGYSW
jgi:hypothetical protein